MSSCQCGCGLEAKKNNKFLIGHNSRIGNINNIPEARKKKSLALKGIKKSDFKNRVCNLCKCGCGNLVKHPKNSIIHGHNKYWQGKKIPDYIKEKISNSLIGDKNPFYGKKHSENTKLKCSNANKNNKYWAGKHHSDETKRKIGMMSSKRRHSIITRLKISESLIGERNGNWRGGSSFEPYCTQWTKWLKEQIKERDGYKCKNPECYGGNSKLTVHHIDYNKLNCSTNNLITICNACNCRANHKRNYWENLYGNIIANSHIS